MGYMIITKGRALLLEKRDAYMHKLQVLGITHKKNSKLPCRFRMQRKNHCQRSHYIQTTSTHHAQA